MHDLLQGTSPHQTAAPPRSSTLMAQDGQLLKSNLHRLMGWEEEQYFRFYHIMPSPVSTHQAPEESSLRLHHDMLWEFEPPPAPVTTPCLSDFFTLPEELQFKIAGMALECPGVVYVMPRDPKDISAGVHAFVVAGIVQGTQEFPVDLSFLFASWYFYQKFRSEFLRNNTFFFRNMVVKDAFESYFFNPHYRALSCPLAWADSEAMNVVTKSLPAKLPTSRLKRVKLGFLVDPPTVFLNTSGGLSAGPKRVSRKPDYDKSIVRWQRTGRKLADLSELHEVQLDLEVHDPSFDESEWNNKDRRGRFEATIKHIKNGFLEALGEKSDDFNVAYTRHARIVSLIAGRKDRFLIVVIDLYHGRELRKARARSGGRRRRVSCAVQRRRKEKEEESGRV